MLAILLAAAFVGVAADSATPEFDALPQLTLAVDAPNPAALNGVRSGSTPDIAIDPDGSLRDEQNAYIASGGCGSAAPVGGYLCSGHRAAVLVPSPTVIEFDPSAPEGSRYTPVAGVAADASGAGS